jgi:hypothetical protein
MLVGPGRAKQGEILKFRSVRTSITGIFSQETEHGQILTSGVEIKNVQLPGIVFKLFFSEKQFYIGNNTFNSN